jgi:YD repeat-containing protein
MWEIYHTVREIESTFRCLKTDLDIRPVFHQKDINSEAHLFIGILAYQLVHAIRETEEKGFDGLKRSYECDLAGQALRVTHPDKRKTACEYDPCERVTKVTYNPDAKTSAEEIYEYRRDGALMKAVNADSEVILECDVLGRVIKEICNGHEITSKYDLSGNRTRITSHLGIDVRADYNIMGDVVSLADGGWQRSICATFPAWRQAVPLRAAGAHIPNATASDV